MDEEKKALKSSKWGKGKTDPKTWWKKGGPSPNPMGRPKGTKNQKTLYKEAFEQKITVNMDGKQKTMSKKELGYHQVAQKAANGDLKAFQIQKELDERYDPPKAAPPSPEDSTADYATLEAWIELREKFHVFKKKDEADG
ncbi:DUF5681 domain-containing protein [Hyphomicrobium sp.]|jgi:hypothetical protein|uniref:DUF5681 domain-containing protein n=1 Tax=Hyphomicrobium sp. TaxID=82 RepID=UPI002BD31BB9|nr:DUF5681 domain-containing protein [Hyphomicrobium sp.]HVZ03949.1 DUF5681 domain-containing protein [Hyphomicrobium sp.]